MPQICGNKQSNLRIPITGHLGRQRIHTTQIPKEDSEVTAQSNEYRCEAYAILYSFHQSDRSIRPRIRGRSQKPRTSIGTTDRNGEPNPIQMLFRFSVRRRFHRRDVRPCCPIRAHALQTESRTAHRSIGTSQKGTGLLNLILIKTGTNMFAVFANGHTVGNLRRETINRKHMWHATGINGSQGIFQSKRTAAEWLARGIG